MSRAPEAQSLRSRRAVLGFAGAGAAGLGAAVLAGCGTSKPLRAQVTQPLQTLSTDVELLNHVLDLEHVAIAAYTAGTPLLTPAAAKAAKLFLNDELAHAGALIELVKAAGGKPHTPAPSYNLGHPRTSADVLRLLHTVERAQLAAYLTAIPQLAPGKVKQSAVSIFANDAQHVSVLRAALGRQPVPSAFVTGRE